MSRYVSYRDFDWLLLVFVLLICGMGVMEIRSATMHTKFAGAHIKQMYWVVAGVGMMFLMSLVNYQALLEQIHWFYIAGVGSLMGVMVFGQKYLGARRWIKMPGGNHFQPSEWVKLILILAVARYFAEHAAPGALLVRFHEGCGHRWRTHADGPGPARPRNRPDLRPYCHNGCVPGRHAMEAGGGGGLAGRW